MGFKRAWNELETKYNDYIYEMTDFFKSDRVFSDHVKYEEAKRKVKRDYTEKFVFDYFLFA